MPENQPRYWAKVGQNDLDGLESRRSRPDTVMGLDGRECVGMASNGV